MSDWAKAAVNQPSANHVGRAVERIIEREASMAMPERIFEGAALKFRACCSPDTAHALREAVEWVWATAQREAGTAATTHQRTLEALEFDAERLAKERDEARENCKSLAVLAMRLRQIIKSAGPSVWHDVQSSISAEEAIADVAEETAELRARAEAAEASLAKRDEEVKRLRASMKIAVDWAEALKFFADSGTSLAPALAQLRDTLTKEPTDD